MMTVIIIFFFFLLLLVIKGSLKQLYQFYGSSTLPTKLIAQRGIDLSISLSCPKEGPGAARISLVLPADGECASLIVGLILT
ncbi:hypothetical protein GOP47_0014425 [Adiantum capillus-veneris]|uniref:Uncharacterized protein n=1 Tax=Adiantum capillus-veneris TaxID=13818 RepID=A0A9D4ULR4_ADICA|nr:hypothetical protein GOP47_0014425 [Adiantum capillus-veneris]